MPGFSPKKGVVKLHITRAQLEYHMYVLCYANGIKFINLYYVVWRPWKLWHRFGAGMECTNA